VVKRFIKFIQSNEIAIKNTPENYYKIYIQNNSNLSQIEKELIGDLIKIYSGTYYLIPVYKGYIVQVFKSYIEFSKNKGFYMLPNGYSEFFSHFIKNLKIIYNTNVVEISQNKEKVYIKDSTGKIHDAEYVISTLPLGIMKKNIVKFSPPLSADKQTCIDIAQLLKINKVMIEFDENFWGKHFLNILTFKDVPLWLGINFNLINKKNILIFIVNDTYDYKLSEWSVERITPWILKKIKECFPEKNVKIKKLIKTNWDFEPFSMGAFSTGRMCLERVQIWQIPDGRVYFAGEHTAERNASTQGAWISGRDVANKLIELLKNKK
jgi:monoamine oxidase